MSVLGRLRSPLFSERTCPTCGQSFRAKNTNARYCSRAHQMRSWRAAKMLEGTHGQVKGQFARLELAT